MSCTVNTSYPSCSWLLSPARPAVQNSVWQKNTHSRKYLIFRYLSKYNGLKLSHNNVEMFVLHKCNVCFLFVSKTEKLWLCNCVRNICTTCILAIDIKRNNTQHRHNTQHRDSRTRNTTAPTLTVILGVHEVGHHFHGVLPVLAAMFRQRHVTSQHRQLHVFPAPHIINACLERPWEWLTKLKLVSDERKPGKAEGVVGREEVVIVCGGGGGEEGCCCWLDA